MSKPSRKWKSMSLKVEHLRLEVEERTELIDQFEKDFLAELAGIETEDIPGVESKPVIPQVVIDRSGAPEEEEIQPDTSGSDPAPEDAKKLWKSIAVACHPDKTGNDPGKTELYKRAAAAWKSKAYDELYRIAIELGLELPEASEESLQALNGISSDLEKKLKDTEQNVLWMWGTTSPEKKRGIVDIWLASRGKKRKS